MFVKFIWTKTFQSNDIAGLCIYVYCVPETNIEKCIVAARYIFIFSPPASSSFPCRRNVSCGIKGGFYLFSGRPSLCCALNRARLRWWSPLRLMLTCKIFERTTFYVFPCSHVQLYMHCQKKHLDVGSKWESNFLTCSSTRLTHF